MNINAAGRIGAALSASPTVACRHALANRNVREAKAKESWKASRVLIFMVTPFLVLIYGILVDLSAFHDKIEAIFILLQDFNVLQRVAINQK